MHFNGQKLKCVPTFTVFICVKTKFLLFEYISSPLLETFAYERAANVINCRMFVKKTINISVQNVYCQKMYEQIEHLIHFLKTLPFSYVYTYTETAISLLK